MEVTQVNIPSFTAELSLYKSTSTYLPLSSMGLRNGAIQPSMERIEVFGCSPGMIQFGEGESMTCVNPLDLFGGGGGGGGPTVPLGDGPRGGGGGGGPVRPPRPPKPPRPKFRPGPPSEAECKSECQSQKRGNLTWSVACDEYCTCLWKTPNPATVCGRDFKEDTGAKKPPFG